MLRWKPSRSFIEALMAYSLTIVICIVTLVKLGLWTKDLTVPLSYHDGDDVMTQTWIKKVLESGSYLHNDQLGAPFGQDMQDFPMGDSLHYSVIKVLGILVSNDSGVMINLFFLLGFPLAAVTSLWTCRQLGISWGPAILGSLLYAFLPYHFLRGLAHLFLSSYYMIPPLVLVALRIMQDRLWLVRRDETTGKRTWLGSPGAVITAALICILVAASGVYYAFFACFLLLVAGTWSAYERRQLQPLLTAGCGVALISLVLGLVLSPTLLYTIQHGRNPEPMVRQIADCEVFGLRISHLFVPPPGHPLSKFLPAALGGETFNYLGVIGCFGFVVILARLFLFRSHSDLLYSLAVLNGACLLLGTTSGLGWIFNVIVTDKIRCYCRLGVYIAFFSFVAVALLLDRLIKYFGAIRDTVDNPLPLLWVRGGVLVSLTLLTMFGLFDQLTFPGIFGGFLAADHYRLRYTSDAKFFRDLEAAVPPYSMVFQLPIASFPESGVIHGFLPYGHLAGYVHTHNLRFSHGSMKGRFGDHWQRWLEPQLLPEMAQNLAFAGFVGIQIDRRAYPDGGVSLETQLKKLLEVDALVSPDRLKAFFRMGAFTDKLRQRYDTVEWSRLENAARHPIIVHWKSGFSIPEMAGTQHFRWCGPEGELQLENGMNVPRTVVLHWTYDPAVPTQAALNVSSPLLEAGQQTVVKAGEECHWKLTMPPGTHSLRFFTQAPSIHPVNDPRTLVFRVQNLRVTLDDGDSVQTAQKLPTHVIKQ